MVELVWLQRLFGEEHSSDTSGEDTNQVDERMSPGLTGEYDLELHEKAGMRQPPPPPEYMGLEGEHDPNGLAKRVAPALDQEPDIADIETLQVTQAGSTVIFEGAVPSVFCSKSHHRCSFQSGWHKGSGYEPGSN